nr:MAG TPA: hypothetical protein [Caudoviricetes sp.]
MADWPPPAAWVMEQGQAQKREPPGKAATQDA